MNSIHAGGFSVQWSIRQEVIDGIRRVVGIKGGLACDGTVLVGGAGSIAEVTDLVHVNPESIHVQQLGQEGVDLRRQQQKRRNIFGQHIAIAHSNL